MVAFLIIIWIIAEKKLIDVSEVRTHDLQQGLSINA